jgi:hypothetical protein
LRNSSREQQILRFLWRIICDILINLLDILFESLLQHLISFIQTESLKLVHLDYISLKEIDQSARSANENINSSFYSLDLGVYVGFAVDGYHPEVGSIGES